MPEKKLDDPVTVRINRSTRDRIQSHGKYGEVIDDIINRALDKLESAEKEKVKR